MADQEVPPHLNGTFLEIVPEREISQHLEEGMVPSRLPHILQIIMLPSCPDTLLRGHRTVVLPGLLVKNTPLN